MTCQQLPNISNDCSAFHLQRQTVQEKMPDPEGRMHHDPPTQCHVSTDFSLPVKWTIFLQPKKHLPSLLHLWIWQNFERTRTHTNAGTCNRYYVRVPNTIFSIHKKESTQILQKQNDRNYSPLYLSPFCHLENRTGDQTMVLSSDAEFLPDQSIKPNHSPFLNTITKLSYKQPGIYRHTKSNQPLSSSSPANPNQAQTTAAIWSAEQANQHHVRNITTKLLHAVT